MSVFITKERLFEILEERNDKIVADFNDTTLRVLHWGHVLPRTSRARKNLGRFLLKEYPDRLKAFFSSVPKKNNDDEINFHSSNEEDILNTFNDTFRKTITKNIDDNKITNYTIELLKCIFDIDIFQYRNSKTNKLSQSITFSSSRITEIMELEKVLESGLSLEDLFKQFYEIVDIYFPDGETWQERVETGKVQKWCEMFDENPYCFLGIMTKEGGELRVVAYIDCYLVNEDFYQDWLLGLYDITELIMEHKIGPKYISRDEKSYLYIETMVVNQVTYPTSPEIVISYIRKFITHVNRTKDKFINDNYNLQSVIAHGYSPEGIGFLECKNFKKVQAHFNVQLAFDGSATPLYELKIKK